MSTSSSRRRTNYRQQTVEDEALSEVAREAEARLIAKRAVRTEAREIRIREIERQQLEEQEKERNKNNQESKKDFPYVTSSRYTSRKDSDDTIDDLKRELSDLQEKYVKIMTHNAQLDNDKQSLYYRVSLLKDDVDDLNEIDTELKRQLKDKTRDFDHKKKQGELLQATVSKLQEQLEQRDLLIQEHGLIFVSDDIISDEEDKPMENKDTKSNQDPKKRCALVSQRAVEVLEGFSGTLDERLVKLDEERKAMERLIKKLKRELDEERERRSVTDRYMSHSPTPNRITAANNGGSIDGKHDAESSTQAAEQARQLNDYKFKLKKAQQDITTLEGNVVRLEGQVKRHRTAAEASEKNEEELRTEKRKMQKEMRDFQNAKSELEMERNHLLKRLERSKGSKNK